MPVGRKFSLEILRKYENELKRVKSWGCYHAFYLQCVKLILSELFFSLLPTCPEWLVPMANNLFLSSLYFVLS